MVSDNHFYPALEMTYYCMMLPCVNSQLNK